MTVAASTISYDGRDIAFADYGPYWRRMRKLFVREMMSNPSLDASCSLRRREVRKCIGILYGKAGLPVDIGELSHFLLVNMVMAMLWGHTLAGEKGKNLSLELRKVTAEVMVVLGKPNIADIFPALASFDVQGVGRQAKRLNSWLENFLNFVISCAIERKGKDVLKEEETGNVEKRRDFLQLFLDLRMEGKENNVLSSTENRELKAILTVSHVSGFLLSVPLGNLL